MSAEHKKTDSYSQIKDIERYEGDLFKEEHLEELDGHEKSQRQIELERRARIEQNHLKRVRKKEFYHLRITLAFIGVGVFALLGGYWVSQVQNNVKLVKEENTNLEESIVVQEVSSIIYQDWKLKLVNQDNPLQFLYSPELSNLSNGVEIDERIEEDLQRMIQAGKSEAGVDILVVMGYVSRFEQIEMFNNAIKAELEKGSEYFVAYTRVVKSVQLPAYDERELGLTVSLVGRDYQVMDKKQQTTATAIWLIDNCHRFGFVLRYPEGKESITGYDYQSWSYRYVGQNVAGIIMDENKTLEEYLNTK